VPEICPSTKITMRYLRPTPEHKGTAIKKLEAFRVNLESQRNNHAAGFPSGESSWAMPC
jgi:hypothetical protein